MFGPYVWSSMAHGNFLPCAILDQTLEIFIKSTIRSKTFIFQIWVIQASNIDMKIGVSIATGIVLGHTPCSRSILMSLQKNITKAETHFVTCHIL